MCVKFNAIITIFDGILSKRLKSFTEKVLRVSENSFFLDDRQRDELGAQIRTYVSRWSILSLMFSKKDRFNFVAEDEI